MWVRGLKPHGSHATATDKESHPMWVRGLKLYSRLGADAPNPVAPYVGAWIETNVADEVCEGNHVAPYVGAWIETVPTQSIQHGYTVAPYVGAWIETFCLS